MQRVKSSEKMEVIRNFVDRTIENALVINSANTSLGEKFLAYNSQHLNLAGAVLQMQQINRPKFGHTVGGVVDVHRDNSICIEPEGNEVFVPRDNKNASGSSGVVVNVTTALDPEFEGKIAEAIREGLIYEN